MEEYGLAIDIGTTTLVIGLFNINDKTDIGTYVILNKQRIYGRNVIDRIKAASEGKAYILREIIIKEILKGIKELVKDIELNKIKKTAIACNTTMSHILLNYPCNNLGIYPYTPYNIKHITKPFKEIFESDLLDVNVNILPGISTFVGGDIVAGMYYTEFYNSNDINILIDLGTNGEMAIGNKDKILVTSTAVGPAFEGGSIAYGVDAIAIIADLLQDNIIDETGLLIDEYFDKGYIIDEEKNIKLTQKNIRDIQLAKAAVRAGIEVLMKNYKTNYNNINKIYIAGNFGYYLDTKKAAYIGLIPEEFSTKALTLGNGALEGAKKYLFNKSDNKELEQLVRISSEITLSKDEYFNDLYIEYMNF